MNQLVQIFTIGVSAARDEKASYVAWGHSAAVSPWYTFLSYYAIAFLRQHRGDVLVACDEKPALLYADLGALLASSWGLDDYVPHLRLGARRINKEKYTDPSA